MKHFNQVKEVATKYMELFEELSSLVIDRDKIRRMIKTDLVTIQNAENDLIEYLEGDIHNHYSGNTTAQECKFCGAEPIYCDNCVPQA